MTSEDDDATSVNASANNAHGNEIGRSSSPDGVFEVIMRVNKPRAIKLTYIALGTVTNSLVRSPIQFMQK